jgi:hypothetical protein
MDNTKPKVIVKKKKIKKKSKPKAKAPTQMQTQKVIVNLSDVLKTKSKSRKRTSTKTKQQEPQIIYQPAPLPLQPDLQNIIRTELSKIPSSKHQQLTPSKIEQVANNLVPIPQPEVSRTESPKKKTIDSLLSSLESIGKNIGEIPIILDPPDEEPILVTTPEPVLLTTPEPVMLTTPEPDFQFVGVPKKEPQITETTFEEKAKRGRPLGTKLSDETKQKISQAVARRAKQKKAAAEAAAF